MHITGTYRMHIDWLHYTPCTALATAVFMDRLREGVA
jgi:hypothetical protein